MAESSIGDAGIVDTFGGGGADPEEIIQIIADAGFVTESDLTTALSAYTTTSALTVLLDDYATEAWVNGVLSGYVTSSFLATTLSDYVTLTSFTTTLADYVTDSSLSTTLGDYVTESTFSTTLLDYPTETEVNNALSNYVLSTALATTLASYVTSTSLTTTLSGYVTSGALTTALSSYVTSSSLTTTLSSYVTSSSLTTTLSSYVTSASLTTTLAGYVTSSSLTTTLSGYSTTSATTAAIAAAKAAEDAAGENGWVIGAYVSMSGVASLDMTGVPSDANEVLIRIQGLSTTGTPNLAGQFLDASNNVISGSGYFGYTSVNGTSTTAGTAWSGVGFMTAFPTLVAANSTSGIIHLKRMASTNVWSITGLLMDATRQAVAIGIKDAMTTFGGFRLTVAAGTFDAGNCGLSWRK